MANPADVAPVDATTDTRIHPRIQIQVTAYMARPRTLTGDLDEARRPLDPTVADPADEAPVHDGVEEITVEPDHVIVRFGTMTYRSRIHTGDYGPILRGERPITDLVAWDYPYLPFLLRAVLSGEGEVAGLPELRRAINLTPGTPGSTEDRLNIPNTMKVERWVAETEERSGWAVAAELREVLGHGLRQLDPYRAAGHLLRALAYRQSVQYGILDEDLRAEARGAAERLADIAVDHVAGLAARAADDSAAPPVAAIALQTVSSVKSRALIELMGTHVPPPDNSPTIVLERKAQDRYDHARAAGDHGLLRAARQELESLWAELIAAGGPGAEYAALRAGIPMQQSEVKDLLARLATRNRPQ